MNKAGINQLMSMDEWQDVLAVFKRHFDIKINKSDTTAEIGKKYLAKLLAEEAFNNALSELNVIRQEFKKSNISYK